jgi:hypothetical protein
LRGRVFGPGLSRVSGERKIAVTEEDPGFEEETLSPIVSARRTFAMIPTGVLTSGISDRALRVYAALRCYVRPGHATFPKLTTVAKQFGMSESYIKRGLAELRKEGLVSVEKRQYSGGFRRVNSYYFPDVEDNFRDEDEVESDRSQGVTNDTPTRGTAMDRPNVSPKPPSKEVEKQEVEKQEREPSVATLPTGDGALFAVVDPHEPPEAGIAKRAHDNTKGALPFMGMRQIAKWAIHTRGTDPGQVEKAIADLYKSGRAVTKQSVGQMLDGYAKSRPAAAKTSREIIDEGKAQMARFAAMDEAEEQHRLQLGTGK